MKKMLLFLALIGFGCGRSVAQGPVKQDLSWAGQLKVTALDPNGTPLRAITTAGAGRIPLDPATPYYILERK